MVKHVSFAVNDDAHDELDDRKGERSWPDAVEDWAEAEATLQQLISAGEVDQGTIEEVAEA